MQKRENTNSARVGIGRQKGLKSPRGNSHAGSNPAERTNFEGAPYEIELNDKIVVSMNEYFVEIKTDNEKWVPCYVYRPTKGSVA